MSAAPGTDLVAMQGALTAMDRLREGLADLEHRFKGVVFDVSTADGMRDAKQARADIREPRYELERQRKAGKAEILKVGKDLDKRAAAIESAIRALETPVDAAIAAEEKRIADEKTERIRLEQARITAGREFVAQFGKFSLQAVGVKASSVAAILEQVRNIAITDDLREFKDSAYAAKEESIARLEIVLAERTGFEREQASLEAVRVDNARIARETAAERQRVDAIAAAQREAQAPPAMTAASVVHAEKGHNSLGLGAAPGNPPRVRPSTDALIAAVQEHFPERRSVVIGWLREIDWDRV